MDDELPTDSSVLPSGAWEAMAAQSQDLVCATDRHGFIIWSNARFRDGTGAGRSTPLRDLARPGADGDAARQTFDDAIAGGSLEATGLAVTAADETTLWLDARVSRLDALLLWTFRDATAERFLAEQARRQGELIDTAQEFGRLGLWERRIPSGEGHWDRHVFRFWGLEPRGGTPSFEEAIERMHPHDRAMMSYRESTRVAGRYAQHFRVVHPDGRVVRIHSQWEVKNGPDGTPDRAVGMMMDDTEVYNEASNLGDIGDQLRLAVELGNIAIWRHELETQLMYYNERAFAVLDMPVRHEGIPIDEIRAFIHPDDVPRVLESAQHALQSDVPTDMEARYLRSDGSWRTVLTRRVVERDREGRPVAFVGVALDVTEAVEQRRRAEELARRLEIASRESGVGVWSTAIDPPETDWSAQMYALFDRFAPPTPPTLRQWLAGGVHPEDVERVEKATRAIVIDGDAPFEIEFRARTRTGAARWIVLRATVDQASGTRRRLLGVAIDVTEHHLALEALRDAGERTRLITRYAGIGTWELRIDGGIETWDEQMFRLRGLAPQPRAPGREDRLSIVHPDDREKVLDADPGVVTNGPSAYEFRVQLPDGRWRWLASRSALVVDDAGRPARRVGVNWDVTEVNEAEGARRLAAIAGREIQAKSQFLSRMSHELRTPLNAVLGFTQLLQLEAGRAGDAAQVAKLGHVRSAGEHLLSLINDVLDLSGLESGELRLAPKTIDLAASVREAVPLVESLAAQHEVTIDSHAAGTGNARADPTRLRQVLINLLSNAIKYNRRGGRVFVDSRVDPDGATLRIRDTGRGLTRTQLACLFEPFNRFGAEHEGIEGTGIGLVIVKALVEGMQGTVDIDSAIGQGTTVTLRLPAAAASDEPATEEEAPGLVTAAAPLVEGGLRGRLLYIEDNPVNVLLVEELVQVAGGFEIVSETTGGAGVERARRTSPDLVLIDLQLPDIDGYEVLRRLRELPETATTRCIALSANAMPDDRQRGLDAGFDEYWTKPIDFAAFVASLQRLFPAGNAALAQAGAK